MDFSIFLKILSIQITFHQWLNVKTNPRELCRLENVEMLSVTSCVERRRCRCGLSCFKFQTIRYPCFG